MHLKFRREHPRHTAAVQPQAQRRTAPRLPRLDIPIAVARWQQRLGHGRVIAVRAAVGLPLLLPDYAAAAVLLCCGGCYQLRRLCFPWKVAAPSNVVHLLQLVQSLAQPAQPAA